MNLSFLPEVFLSGIRPEADPQLLSWGLFDRKWTGSGPQTPSWQLFDPPLFFWPSPFPTLLGGFDPSLMSFVPLWWVLTSLWGFSPNFSPLFYLYTTTSLFFISFHPNFSPNFTNFHQIFYLYATISGLSPDFNQVFYPDKRFLIVHSVFKSDGRFHNFPWSIYRTIYRPVNRSKFRSINRSYFVTWMTSSQNIYPQFFLSCKFQTPEQKFNFQESVVGSNSGPFGSLSRYLIHYATEAMGRDEWIHLLQ